MPRGIVGLPQQLRRRMNRIAPRGKGAAGNSIAPKAEAGQLIDSK
jgi:hypothetical protein